MSERNDEIVRLWNLENSALTIGKQLGITKNTVIAVVTKSRLKGLITREKLPSNRSRGLRGQLILRNKKRVVSKPAALPKPVSKNLYPSDEDPVAVGVSFMDLSSTGCKYPTSRFDGQHFFCGEPRRDSKTSYCSAHHSLCWQKPGRKPPTAMVTMSKNTGGWIHTRARTP
jgi:hypothetical protein